MNRSNLQKLKKFVAPDSHQILVRIFNKETLGKHYDFLNQELESEKVDINKIIKYSVEHLPTDESRPDSKLSNLFFIVSEIKFLSEEIRSLATDMMIYSENDSSVPTPTREDLISAARQMGDKQW